MWVMHLIAKHQFISYLIHIDVFKQFHYYFNYDNMTLLQMLFNVQKLK